MPELAEVKIMSEYINDVSKTKVFKGIRKNPVNKNPEFKVQYQKFTIHSENRGKELRLIINSYPRIPYPPKILLCGMGMAGNWSFVKKGEEPKHSHLKCLILKMVIHFVWLILEGFLDGKNLISGLIIVDLVC
jgi:formamidopyrimidine-DNA glycosylase